MIYLREVSDGVYRRVYRRKKVESKVEKDGGKFINKTVKYMIGLLYKLLKIVVDYI